MATPPVGLVHVIAKLHPLREETTEFTFPADELSISEIVETVQPDPFYRQYVHVSIMGTWIPPEAWPHTYPMAGALVNIAIVAGNAQQGALAGGSALTIAGTILLAVPGAQPIGIGLIVAGTALTLAATYLLAPSPPETNEDTSSDTYNLNRARNRIDRWGACPRLAGRFRFAPKIAAKEYSELIGDDRYLRVIFYLSDGPVTTPDIYIGETSIDEYDEVETQFRRGYPFLTDKGNWPASSGEFPSFPDWADTYTISTGGVIDGQTYTTGETITFNGEADYSDHAAWDRDQGKAFTLYANDVNQQALGVDVTRDGGPQVRTSVQNADELSIDLLFVRGMVFFENNPPGKKASDRIDVSIAYSPTGQNDWRSAAGGTFRISGRTDKPFFWGLNWKTDGSDPNGQYDVRVTRLSRDTENDARHENSFQWASLKTTTYTNPVPIGGHAMLAMRVRASGQINGSLDQVFCDCQSIAKVWDGTTWDWAPTSSSAALHRATLQNIHWPRARLDAHLDIAKYEEWYELSADKGWECNAYFDSDQSMWDRLQTIAATGMASTSAENGLWTVVIDDVRPYPRQMFTPTNTWDYSGEIVQTDVPHALRQRYWDKDKLYDPTELIVYADGYDENTAAIYERNTLIGITDPEQAYVHARQWLARKQSQKEIHRFNCDIEHIVANRGDRILLGHTVIAVTLATGRIKETVVSSGLVTQVVLTCNVEMEEDRSYGLMIRHLDEIKHYDVDTVDGRTDRLTLTTSVDEDGGPQAGDLVSFGINGTETLDLLVATKEPGANYSARIEAIPYVPGIYTAADFLPPFVSGVPYIRSVPSPIVEDIISDATVMLVTPDRKLLPQIVIRLTPTPVSGSELYAWYRPTNTDHGWKQVATSSIGQSVVTISFIEEGEEYDLRLQYTHPDYLTSKPTEIIGHKVIGKSAPPSDLAGLTLGKTGGQAELRWSTPPDRDVLIGGAIAFRHSPALTGATWQGSTSIGVGSVSGNQTSVVLPLKEGTYLAKVVDSSGLLSENAASVTTLQASVFSFSQVGVALESPTFLGTKFNTEVSGSQLRLVTGDIDDIPDIDEVENIDDEGVVVRREGTYTFNTTIDLGSVTRVRLTSTIDVVISDAFDLIDTRTEPIDQWPDIDGSAGAPADAYVEYSTTDDDPSGSPTWGPWLRLDSVEEATRGIRGRAILYTSDRSYNVAVTTLQIKAETVDAIT